VKGITITILICLLLPQVAAIGVSPPRFEINYAIRGSTVEKEFRVSGLNSGEEPVFSVEGEASGWLTFSIREDNKESGIPIVMSVHIPHDAKNGDYEAFIRVQPNSRPEDLQGDAGVNVLTGVRMELTVHIIGEQHSEYKITGIDILNSEEKENITVLVAIKNLGNVEAGPDSVHFEIWDKDRNSMISVLSKKRLNGAKPFREDDLLIEFSHSLNAGQYWGQFSAIDEGVKVFEEGEIFEILLEGDSNRSGTLTEFSVPGIVILGEIIPVRALFRNDGNIPVLARLVTEISRGGQIEAVIESESEKVLPGEESWISVYFSPDEPGDYHFSGHVIYDQKKTETHTESSLVVLKPEKENPGSFSEGYGILLFPAIVFLIFVVTGIMIWSRNKK